jgi:hypothetical protein
MKSDDMAPGDIANSQSHKANAAKGDRRQVRFMTALLDSGLQLGFFDEPHPVGGDVVCRYWASGYENPKIAIGDGKSRYLGMTPGCNQVIM